MENIKNLNTEVSDTERLDDMRKQAPAPAGVPEPGPAGWYVSGSDPEHAALWLDRPDDDQMQVMNQQCDDGPVVAQPLVLGADAKRYGDAREAAGYIKGVKAENNRCKQVLIEKMKHYDGLPERALAAQCFDHAQSLLGGCAYDAALREEVKS